MRPIARRWSAWLACACIVVGTPARAQLLQQYLPDISAPPPGQAGAAIAPDVTATPRGETETQPGTTVENRPHPDFQSSGLHLGSFYLTPQYTESLGYNSNLFADRSGRGALMVENTPSVRVASDWANMSLYGGVLVDNTIYPDNPTQSFTNWTGDVGGSYDIGRDQLTIRYRHAGLHIARGTIDSGNFDNPIPFQVDTLYASYLVPFARVSFEPAFEFTNQRFSNGTYLGMPVVETSNTHNAAETRLTTRYELSPLRDLVLVTRGITENFYEPQPRQPSRNSRTFEVLAGIDFSVSAVARVRALVGYEQRNFTNSTFSTRTAPVTDMNVIWTPTQLTTVTAGVSRSIEDGLSTTTTGFTYTTLQIKVDHELLRNVILTGHTAAQFADFASNQGSQEIYNGGVQANWHINRNTTLGGRYDYTYRQSTPTQGQSYSQNVMLISLGLHL